MRPSRLRLQAVFTAFLLFPLASCEVLGEIAQAELENQTAAIKPLMPTVTYEGAELVQSPSKYQMAAYYCPIIVPDPFGIPGSAAVACVAAFGTRPTLDQMRVAFDLKFKVNNPNKFPIPVAELLTAATVFPEKTNQSLGAICVAFCGADQPDCTGAPGPDACKAKENDIKSLGDFRNAASNLLIAKGIQLLAGEEPTFKMPEVVQDAEVLITMRFSFGAEALLGVLRELANQALAQIKAGNIDGVEFKIPYIIEGTVWIDVGELGRVAVGFGPAAGTWIIPTAAIVP